MLSWEPKDRHSHIRWQAFYGFRNILAHAYLGLHMEQVWEIVSIHLPRLKVAVREELSRM